MSRRVLLVVWLAGLWVVLWRDPSVGNVAAGLVLGVLVSTGATGTTIPAIAHRVRPLALVRFAAYFSWKLLEANVVLAREVVTPTNVIRTGIIAVPLAGYGDFLVTVVANAISLTPGTLTLDVRKTPNPILYVHVLHLGDIDDARQEAIRMAEYASAAFPPVDAPRSEEPAA